MIEITGPDGVATKGSTVSTTLDLADIGYDNSATRTARLKKRVNGGDWDYVETGVTYIWSKSGSCFSLKDTDEQTVTVKAGSSTGSGSISVSASLDGGSTTVASSDPASVTVNDHRSLLVTPATTTVTSGIVTSATVKKNYTSSKTATITADSDVLLGTSESDVTESSVTVSLDDSGEGTVYFKYTGSTSKTVSIYGNDGIKSGSGSVEAEKAASKKPVSLDVTITSSSVPYTGGNSSAIDISKNSPVYFTVTYDDGTSAKITSSSSGTLSITSSMPYASVVYNTSTDNGNYYVSSSGVQFGTAGASTNISASYTENGTTVSTSGNHLVYIYSWVSQMSKNGSTASSDALITFACGATKTVPASQIYFFDGGMHTTGWGSAVSPTGTWYVEQAVGGFYVMNGQYGQLEAYFTSNTVSYMVGIAYEF